MQKVSINLFYTYFFYMQTHLIILRIKTFAIQNVLLCTKATLYFCTVKSIYKNPLYFYSEHTPCQMTFLLTFYNEYFIVV